MCYHKWSYFNHYCNACSEFTYNKNHGVMVHHCFLCGAMWDCEFGFWTTDDVLNHFFNEYYDGM